jgi:hypothetical protein
VKEEEDIGGESREGYRRWEMRRRLEEGGERRGGYRR